MPMWHCGDQTLAGWGTTTQPGHIRLHPGFVDENQPSRLQKGLKAAPVGTGGGDIGTVLFGRTERLFLYVRPRRTSVACINPSLA